MLLFELLICAVCDLHKEIAKATLVRTNGAKLIVQRCGNLHALTWCRLDVDAVALEVAVDAEISGYGSTLFD